MYTNTCTHMHTHMHTHNTHTRGYKKRLNGQEIADTKVLVIPISFTVKSKPPEQSTKESMHFKYFKSHHCLNKCCMLVRHVLGDRDLYIHVHVCAGLQRHVHTCTCTWSCSCLPSGRGVAHHSATSVSLPVSNTAKRQ